MVEHTTKIKEEAVGMAYEDAWNDDCVRVELDDWAKQKKLSIDDLQSLVEKRNLKLMEYGNSGSSCQIVNKMTIRRCDVCENDLLYNTHKNEYYCPVCDS